MTLYYMPQGTRLRTIYLLNKNGGHFPTLPFKMMAIKIGYKDEHDYKQVVGYTPLENKVKTTFGYPSLEYHTELVHRRVL